MLMRITPRKHAGTARSYYAEERLIPGGSLEPWGTLDIPLGRPVSWRDAPSLFSGKHPDTGVFLGRQKPRATGRRSGWDLTFVSPKSVSILWGLSPDSLREHIVAAYRNAVLAGLGILSRHAVYVRHREETPVFHGGFLFNHGMSRWRDPHLHTHAYLVNAGFDEEAMVWRAINLDARWSYVARDFFTVALAWELVSLGYPIIRRGRYFEMVATRDLAPIFSSAQEVFSANKITSAAQWQEYRRKKDLSKTFSRMRTDWISKAVASGYDMDRLAPTGNRLPPGTLSDALVTKEAKAARHAAHVWHHAARVGLGITDVTEVERVAIVVAERMRSQERDPERLEVDRS